jgi:hypothetical protein
MLGHLNLDMISVVPLLLLFVIRRIRGQLSRPCLVAAFEIALLAQLGLATPSDQLPFRRDYVADLPRRLRARGTEAALGGCRRYRSGWRDHGDPGGAFLFAVFKDLGEVPPMMMQ